MEKPNFKLGDKVVLRNKPTKKTETLTCTNETEPISFSSDLDNRTWTFPERSWEDWRDYELTEFIPFKKEQTQNKYIRTVPSTDIDVYNVLKAFEVTDQAIGHAIKKLLAGGKRGHKDLLTDWQEAIDSIARAIEIEKETHE